jgi:hypothetical protein
MLNAVKFRGEFMSVMTIILIKEHVFFFFLREEEEIEDVVELICSGRSKQYMLFVYSKQTRLYMEEGVARDRDHHHHHHSSV